MEEVKTESYKALAYRGKRYTAIDWLQSIRNQGYDVGLQIRKSNASGELIASQKIYYGNKNKYHQALDLLNPQDTIQLYYSDGSQERITKANFQKQANEGSTILPYWIVLDIDLDHKESIVLENPSLTNRLRALDALNLSYWFFATKEGRGIKVVLQFKNMMQDYEWVKQHKIHDRIGSYLAKLCDCELKHGIQQCSLLYPPEEGHEPIHAKTGKPLYLIHSTGNDNSFMDLVDITIEEEKKNNQQPEEKKEVIKEKVTEKKEESKKEEIKEEIEEKKPIQTIEHRDDLELLKDPKLLTNLVAEIQKRVVGETKTIHSILLSMIGGCLCQNISPTSCNILITDESGAGKDFIVWAVLKIFPEDWVIRRKRITERTLTYWNNMNVNPAWTWDGKILYLEDINQKILNCEVLKTLMSSDEHINYSTIIKEQNAEDIGIKGRPCVIATTYKGNLGIETMRRVTCLFIDTSEEQTERIIMRQLSDSSISNNIKPEYEIYRKALSLLKKVSVIIPFGKRVIPFSDNTNMKKLDSRLSNRTNIQKILDAIKFSATLNQYMRKRDTNNKVIANKEDYDAAVNYIYNTTITDYGAAITRQQKKIIDTMAIGKNNDLNTEWEVNDLHSKFPELKKVTLYKHLENLCFIGAVECRWDRGESDHGHGFNVYSPKGKRGIKMPEWNDDFQKDYDSYINNN